MIFLNIEIREWNELHDFSKYWNQRVDPGNRKLSSVNTRIINNLWLWIHSTMQMILILILKWFSLLFVMEVYVAVVQNAKNIC